MSKEEIGLNGNIDHNKSIRTAKRATIASYGLSGIILMGAALNDIQSVERKTAQEVSQSHPRPAKIELQRAQKVIDKFYSEMVLLHKQRKINQILRLQTQENSATMNNAKEVTRQEREYQAEYKKQIRDKTGNRKRYSEVANQCGVTLALSALVVAGLHRRRA